MAVSVNMSELSEGGSNFTKEECVIPKGFQVCRLVSYIEMGHHYPVFKGVKQKYEAPSKRAGEFKDVEMMLHLVFEFTNAEYTGNYPLTLCTSRPFNKSGDLMNKLHISKGLEEGWCSRSIALKQNYVKTLLAMQDATGTQHPSLASYVGTVFGVNITHTLGKKADEDGNIPTYANMKTTGLVAPTFTNPMTKEVVKMDLPEPIGEYCEVFDWNAPTEEAWALVPKYLKEYIQSAEDYKGSALECMLAGMTEKPAEPEDSVDDTDAPVEIAEDDGLPF